MKTFISTRNQFVNGEPVAMNETVQADPEKVAYLIARGFLVETNEEAKTTRKNSSPRKTMQKKPLIDPAESGEQTDSNE